MSDLTGGLQGLTVGAAEVEVVQVVEVAVASAAAGSAEGEVDTWR